MPIMTRCSLASVHPLGFFSLQGQLKEARLYLSYYLAPSAEYVCYTQ